MASRVPIGSRWRVRAVASVLALAVLPLTACLAAESSETPTPGQTPSPSTSESASPSPSVSASPSPSGIEPSGPITGPPSGTPVTPEIFLATIDEEEGMLRVVVLVPGIYEDGGDCSVTVVGASSTILKTGTGVADVSSTACGQFSFSLTQLGRGTASITAEYESVKYSGASEAMEVQIP
ncbi:MAG: hypothetical protein JW722_06200 [Demequinaceae bacterium]|nr:hypothetical protein [Demequinaceae bacterium]